MQTLFSAYRRQQCCFVVSSINSAQKYISVHARGCGIWKYLPFIDTSQLHASLGGRGFLFSETVWRTSHVSSQEQIQLLAQTPRGLSSCERCVWGEVFVGVAGIAEAVEREERERTKDRRGQWIPKAGWSTLTFAAMCSRSLGHVQSWWWKMASSAWHYG